MAKNTKVEATKPRYFINRIQDELAEATARVEEARKLKSFLQSASFTKAHPDGNVQVEEVLRRLKKIA